ncbi:hypothetical protein L596_030305 [Steinernema carpocapsae]|uniref:NADAR domain-containing protein n=1 Tax=Steinernema carpocapsae TaxID=34508 RepID=A0A4U5LP01_STECR|nr:hypothetical protein L596_030305 [Steinernema carpocapsae]
MEAETGDKVVLIGNESDILHCGYNHALSHEGKRYPSADHFAHAQILQQLGLDDVHILELLGTSSRDVPLKARQLLNANMPRGHTMDSLADYLVRSRLTYTMQGLKLRADQDKEFERTLMDTGEALLIVCDSSDSDSSVGMDEDTFVSFAHRLHANAEVIGKWMKEESSRPPEVGKNQLGFALMWLRYDIKQKRKNDKMTTLPIKVDGISKDQNEEPVKITISEQVLSLTGQYRPLSNFFVYTFEMKGEKFRSVEHYAYQRLFDALRLDDKCIEKIRTTVDPRNVAQVAKRVFKDQKIEKAHLESKISRLDKWRQSAMKHKISKNDILQKLLMSTGHALLIEPYEGEDFIWTAGVDEYELQHLLAKEYLKPEVFVAWFNRRGKLPKVMQHFGGNKSGLLLMELRAKFASGNPPVPPMIAPVPGFQIIRTATSPHLICFSPEGIFHPLYPGEITLPGEATKLPSPMHYVAKKAIEFFKFPLDTAQYIFESEKSTDVWQRLHECIETSLISFTKLNAWFQEERLNVIKTGLKLMFEQHPQLLRTLLDTEDAMLVCCSRYTTTEAELTIGMREKDLRDWMAAVNVDSKQLLDLCIRPLAFRPPYFGGNRLGIILMELRREFVLKGVFPQQLPELPISTEAILGSESPSEAFTPDGEFAITVDMHYSCVWANPYLLFAKAEENKDFLKHAMLLRPAPKFMSVDEPKLQLVQEALEKCEGVIDRQIFDDLTMEDLRAMYVRFLQRIKQQQSECHQQEVQILDLTKKNHDLLAMKRTYEEARDRHVVLPPVNVMPARPATIGGYRRSRTEAAEEAIAIEASCAEAQELTSCRPKDPSTLLDPRR